ncbi:BTB/POZ protein [Phyllosticta citribraziliensis]|uniref:BTB/POZ protein n=1 Tax=Phyllosticta citribraziliensis TaxID=989973 RepID=A0ABR1LNR4_9PEZI
MGTSADNLFRKSIGELLDSGLYADVEVKVGTTTFKAHKAILCTQCDFFRHAFDKSNGFKEAETNVIALGEPTTPEVTRAMLEFLYRGNYTKTQDAESQFVIDVGVFIAGEMYIIPGLKEIAFTRIQEVLNNVVYYSTFPTGIAKIYDFTPENDRSLRNLLVDTAKLKIETGGLLQNQGFNEALETCSGFGKDLVHALGTYTVIWEE